MADRARERSPPRFMGAVVVWSPSREASIEELNAVFDALRQRRIRQVIANGRFTRVHSVTIRYPFLDTPYVLVYYPLPFAALTA